MDDARTTHPDRLRVLCVDDHADFAMLWSAIVDAQDDMVSVGTLGNADRLEAEVTDRGADLVLLDLTMPGRDPLEALDRLVATAPAVRVLVFSGYDDAATTSRVVARGACGLLSKSLDPDQVLARIRTAASRRGGDR